MDRWWDENEVQSVPVIRKLVGETVHLHDDDDYDIADVRHSFVGIDNTAIFAGYGVVLTSGQLVYLYADGRVCDDDDNEIGKHYLYK